MGERGARRSSVAWQIVRRGAPWAATLLALRLLVGQWGSAWAAGEVEVQVRGVEYDHVAKSPVVVLENEGQAKALPIWVGQFEAQAIAMEMQGISAPRPLTHDLIKKIVEELGAEVDRVVIDDLRGHTYYASIHLLSQGNELRVDSRPSDAIALALRFRKPILVKGTLLVDAGASDAAANREPGGIGHLWGLTLQDLTPGLAEFFARGEVHGVLVSDVAPDAAAREVKRGDVITDVYGQLIHTLADLKASAERLDTGSLVRLGLSRQGADMRVSFALDGP